MKRYGFEVNVLYGIYTPSKPRATWDERWQSARGNEFAHFWIGADEKYYDYSCFQFGETSPIKTTCKDSRYEQLGYMEENGKLINTGNMIIEWESLSEVDGVPLLRVVPIFV